MSTPAAQTGFLQDAAGHLVFVDGEGTWHKNVRAARLFPLTQPERWISIQDSEGRELACVEDPEALPEPQKKALHAGLADRAFVPVIHAIHRIARATDGHEWHVTTDRGPTTFLVDTDESIQSLGGTRVVIIDAHNTRYLIPDIVALDRESRRKLERYH